MKQLAAFLDFSTESDPFSLGSPLPQERVLERLVQNLNPDIQRGMFFLSYPGRGPLIGIHEGNRFRLFLRPGFFSDFAGDFQGEVSWDGERSRINGSFREPNFAWPDLTRRGPRTIRGSSFGFVFFLVVWAGVLIASLVQGVSWNESFPAIALSLLFPFVLLMHWHCIDSCRKGRRKILMELAMIAESNDTPWTMARPRKQR